MGSTCHPLISATRHAVEATKPNSDGLLLMNNPGTLNVTVSRQCSVRVARRLSNLKAPETGRIYGRRPGGAASDRRRAQGSRFKIPVTFPSRRTTTAVT
jgi:hypothetical protein